MQHSSPHPQWLLFSMTGRNRKTNHSTAKPAVIGITLTIRCSRMRAGHTMSANIDGAVSNGSVDAISTTAAYDILNWMSALVGDNRPLRTLSRPEGFGGLPTS